MCATGVDPVREVCGIQSSQTVSVNGFLVYKVDYFSSYGEQTRGHQTRPFSSDLEYDLIQNP